MVNVTALYHCLLKKYGPQNWWPCEGEKYGNDEIAIGAILTQNTSWKNVEKALENLRNNNALSLNAIHQMTLDELATLIKPAGFYNQKAQRLKDFANYIVKNYGTLKNFFESKHLEDLRLELLNIKGIGKETADSILLYAGFKNIFVVDKYTHRIYLKFGITANEKYDYDDLQKLTQKYIKNVKDKQEFHALIVALGKDLKNEQIIKEIEECLNNLETNKI